MCRLETRNRAANARVARGLRPRLAPLRGPRSLPVISYLAAELCSSLKLDYAVEDAVGDFELGEFRKRKLTAVAQKEGDDVGVGVEAGTFLGDVVGDNHVRPFAREFAAGIVGEAIRFGGEADQHAPAALLNGVAAKLGENIRRRLELER